MKTHHLIATAALLLELGACSTEQDGSARGQLTSQQSQTLTAASTAPAAASTAPAAQAAAAPTQMSAPGASAALAGPPTVPQPPTAARPPAFATAGQAAAASLGTLAGVVGSGPANKRGFASAAEVNSSTLADGMPVMFVRLDNLSAFQPGQDTKALLFDKQEMMYPITVGGEVRSSVTVQKGPDGTWQAIKFGNAPVAQASHGLRLGVTAKQKVDGGSVSLVEIPTVQAYLLSHTEGGSHMVTPLWDIPGTQFKAGVTQPAAKVFAALQALAAGVDRTVPN